jgi:AcrR family transcriptional regulator
MPPIRPHGSLGRGAHERILAAAGRLFALRGINATSMNDVYLEARVSKRTLYQHFAGKDELVAAYLESVQRDVGAGPQAVLARDDLAPRARLLELFTALAEQPRPVRVDPFVGAAVEFPDRSHPAHRAAAEHGRRLQQWLTDLARAAGARDPEQVGRRLALLYDGAAIRAFVDDDPAPTADAYAIAAAILRDAID